MRRRIMWLLVGVPTTATWFMEGGGRRTSMSTSGSFFFFKTMLDTSKTTLLIPPKFHGNIENLVDQRTSIEVSEGKSWTVHISRFENCLVFQQVWESFVEAHCIEIGEAMVFRYFAVQIFEKTGCERLHFSGKANSGKLNYNKMLLLLLLLLLLMPMCVITQL